LFLLFDALGQWESSLMRLEPKVRAHLKELIRIPASFSGFSSAGNE
jgi:hypothetical protein